MYTPPIAKIFTVTALSGSEWAAVMWLSFPVIIVDEVLKLMSRNLPFSRVPLPKLVRRLSYSKDLLLPTHSLVRQGSHEKWALHVRTLYCSRLVWYQLTETLWVVIQHLTGHAGISAVGSWCICKHERQHYANPAADPESLRGESLILMFLPSFLGNLLSQLEISSSGQTCYHPDSHLQYPICMSSGPN